MGGPYPFKAAAFASLDLHVQVANDVSSSSAKGIYNQQELQQLAATIAGQLPFFFFSPPSLQSFRSISEWRRRGKYLEQSYTIMRVLYYMCNRKLIA